MNLNILVEIIIGGVTVLGGMFALIKYTISTNIKREKLLLEHQQAQQTQIMEYYEKKNGHLERISKDFSDSHKEVGKILGALTTEIKILAEKHNN